MPNTLLKVTTWKGRNLVSVARYQSSNGQTVCVWVGTKLHTFKVGKPRLMSNAQIDAYCEAHRASLRGAQ